MRELHFIQAGEHKMAVLAFNGDKGGTPLIFLHGITSSPNFWRVGQTPSIQQEYRWFSLTLPGHYPAQFPRGFYGGALTAELIADVVADAIQQLAQGEKVIVAGHSTGGFAALAVAARHPQIVKGVISVSGFVRGYWTGALRLLQLLARYGGTAGERVFKANLRLLPRSKAVYTQALRAYAADAKALYSDPALPLTVQHLYQDAQHLSPDAMLPYFRRMPDIDITSWLSRIQAPTLVIAGDKDPIVPPKQAQIIAQHVQNSELHYLKGAGHVPMAERQDEYHALITRWLQQHG